MATRRGQKEVCYEAKQERGFFTDYFNLESHRLRRPAVINSDRDALCPWFCGKAVEPKKALKA
jgi:hypothetical protein